MLSTITASTGWRLAQPSRQPHALIMAQRRHADIGYERIDSLLVDCLGHELGVLAFAHNGHPGMAGEQVLDRRTSETRVIGENDPD